MIEYVPGYYKDFRCIADKCRHTCCAGWEIDVDDDSLGRFSGIDDIMSNIKDGCMVLDKEERCPFLLPSGLCRMIKEYGEKMLCDICREHPRFHNDMGDHIETGLGLTCEEACRLILTHEEKFTLVPPRELPSGIRIMTDRDIPVSKRLSALCPFDEDTDQEVSYFMEMERLDERWTSMLQKVLSVRPSKDERDLYIDSHPVQFEQFAVYLLYRHGERRLFAVRSAYLLADICLSTGEDILEAARMFSTEVEYSDINDEIISSEEIL